MKESYFTPETIQDVSGEIIRKLAPYQRMVRIPFIPERSALLILDMQEVFLNKYSHAYIPSAPVIVHNINTLSEAFHRNNFPVIITRHVNTEHNAGMMKAWWNTLIDAEYKGSDLIESIDTVDCKIIEKTQYDAFYRTELNDFLLDNNIEQLVVTGVMTHLCCESTVRSAFVRGFTVFFPVDGTATYNLDFHMSTCRNLSHGFAICTLCKKMTEQI